MKKKLILILFLTTLAYGANEIKSYFESGNTLYAIIRNDSGQAWDTGDAAFEAWNDADDYNIPLVDKSGGFYIGDFNTAVTAGYYSIITHQQEGGTAADTDPPIWKDYGYWDGTTWTSGASISDINSVESKIDDVLADTNELQTDWTNGGRLDLLLDGIKAYTDLIVIVDTNVATAGDANEFTINTEAKDSNDIYNGCIGWVQDANTSHWEPFIVEDYNSARVVILDHTLGFTPAQDDEVRIMGTSFLGFNQWLWDYLPRTIHEFDFTPEAVIHKYDYIRD